MKSFPDFMKHPARLIAPSEQNTKDIEDYYFEGPDGCQMAFWECYKARESNPHTHNFDEYMVCVKELVDPTAVSVKMPLQPYSPVLLREMS